MRMWMVDPKLLCREHLLGEHNELHKFVPSFKKKRSVAGRLGQIELSKYRQRHDELAIEMVRRGYNHSSPIEVPDFSYLPLAHYEAIVDKGTSLKELCKRCTECRKRIKTGGSPLDVLNKIIPNNKFILSKVEISSIKKRLKINTDELLLELIHVAKRKARASISNYSVGAVGLTRSGKIIFGNNLEFKGVPINQSVHAEQFLAVLTLIENEQLYKIAISAEPCGHCRQFLNEIPGAAKKLKILIPGKTPRYLGELLPASFGPSNLNVKDSIYSVRDNKLQLDGKTKDKLVLAALKSANMAYAPYSHSYSGVAIKTKEGNIYSGFYVENVAFNPSVQPITAAIIKLVSEGVEYNEITEVILVEKKNATVRQTDISEDLIKAISSSAKFKVVFSI